MPVPIVPVIYLNSKKTVRLSHDGLQWILEKGSPKRQQDGKDSGFRGQSFVRSTKDVLLRCIREKKLPIDIEGRRILAKLPATYKDFMAQVEKSGLAAISNNLHGSAKDALPIPYRLVVSRHQRRQNIGKRLNRHGLRSGRVYGKRDRASISPRTEPLTPDVADAEHNHETEAV